MSRSLVLCALFALLTAFLLNSPLAEAATLQGYWRLNETSVSDPAVDSSGNSLPSGTYITGTDPTVAGPFAGFGTGANFPGGAGEINVGGGTALNYTSGFSVSGWMNLDDTSGTNNYTLIGNAPGSPGGWAVRSIGTAPRITTFGVKDYTGTGGTLSATAGWQHVVVVLDSSFDATFYVDGAPAGSEAFGSPGAGGSMPFFIGSHTSGNTSEDMHGSIDDVGVFSGELTAIEVQAIYNLASEAALQYDLGEVDQMLTAFINGDDEVIIDGTTWRRVAGLTGAAGLPVDIGDGAFEINLGSGVGFSSALIPEPTSIAMWSMLSLALAAYGWRRLRRR